MLDKSAAFFPVFGLLAWMVAPRASNAFTTSYKPWPLAIKYAVDPSLIGFSRSAFASTSDRTSGAVINALSEPLTSRWRHL